MIRIRPGRSWRLNPAYVGQIRSAKPASFTGADVLDVLGIEVDGVDLAAGLGEARVLQAVDELAQAVLRLARGAPAAQATVGRGPTELVLEPRGADVALSLVSLAPPARVLASGLVVPGARMRAAAAHAATSIRADLLAISGSLRASPLTERLSEAAEQLATAPRRKARPWPQARARAVNLVGAAGGVQLSVEVPDTTAARLQALRQVMDAPLAAHLGPSRLRLQAEGVPGLEAEAPALLLLRNLLREAGALAEAREGGARAHELHFGAHALHVELARDELRAAGWRKPAHVPALELCATIADAALRYVAAFASPRDELLLDLRDRAQRVQRHVQDLESGDLRRAPEVVLSPPRREARSRPQPLSRGRMRRLVYRRAWTVRAPAAASLRWAPHRLLVELPSAVAAYDLQSGREVFRAQAAPGMIVRGEALFLNDPSDGLLRFDAQSGAQRWRRRLRGATHPSRLFPVPDGVARTLPGEGLAVVTDAGALAFRQKLPGGAPVAISAEDGVLLVALPQSLVGLDASDGHVLWKRRLRATALFGSLVVTQTSVAALDPHTGEGRWQQLLPVRAACLSEDVLAVLSGERLVGLSAAEGAQRFSLPLPWAEELRPADEADACVLATSESMAACVRGAKVAWRRELPARPAQVQGRIALVGTRIVEIGTGQQLAELPGPATLGPDLSCAVLDDAGVSLYRLGGHLSIV